MINKEYETQVAMAEAYASAYCNARELTGISPVWSGVRAGYLKALQDSKKEITDSERLDWMINNEERVRKHESGLFSIYFHGGERFENARDAIDAAMQAEKGKDNND